VSRSSRNRRPTPAWKLASTRPAAPAGASPPADAEHEADASASDVSTDVVTDDGAGHDEDVVIDDVADGAALDEEAARDEEEILEEEAVVEKDVVLDDEPHESVADVETVTDDEAYADEHDEQASDEQHDLVDDIAYDDDLAYDDEPADDDRPGRRYGPIESVLRKPRLALVPVIVLVTLAGLAGVMRQPVYTAGAQVIVGGVVRNFEPAQGQVEAIQELTDIYSRLVGSSAHLDEIAQADGGIEVAPGSLTAAPIPGSALIRIEATGTDQAQAVAIADAAATGLVSYVQDLRTEASANSQQLLDQMTVASDELAVAQLDRTAKQNAYEAAVSAGSGIEAAREALAKAEATVATGQLKVEVLRSNYSTTQAAQTGGIAVSVFAAAQPEGGDRTSKLSLYLFAALAIGGLIGMALATLSANHWQLLPSREPSSDA
jgi:capsular polysaccharide biosynthesis protein